MKSTIDQIKLLNIPKVHDHRGKIAVVENDTIPFLIKRVYYLYDIPTDAYRGGHAHREQKSLLIALSGSFEVIVKDGKKTQRIVLNKADKGLFIPSGIWREIENFSSGSVCLVLASTIFNEQDYIRNYESYISEKPDY